MKTLYLSVLAVILCSGAAFSQECATFFPFEPGTVLKYENFDRKGKSDGIVTNTIKGVEEGADGTLVQIRSSQTDKKGKNTFETDFEIQCLEDGYSMRITDMMMPELTEQLQSMEIDMEITGENLFIPNELSVGMTLPDANMVMQPNMGGMNLMKFEYTTSERRVTAKEAVTTPAGTFECYLLESYTSIKTMGKRIISSKEWLAEGIGVVRSETYDKNGKSMGSMVLVGME